MNKVSYEAYDIHYDTDGYHIRELPAKVPIQATSLQEAKLRGADQISNQTGWLVSSFKIRKANERNTA